jgi:hypothetical protein
VSAFAIDAATGVTGNIRNKPAYTSVDLNGPVIPAWTSGRIQGVGNEPAIIAILVNDEIAALTRTTINENGDVEYGAIVPPDAFVEGRNDVELAVVTPDGDAWRLGMISS